MKAVIFTEVGGTDKLKYVEDFPKPELRPGYVVIKVKACALNHLDIWVRQGLPGTQPMPHISGSDVAGIVEDIFPDPNKPEWIKPGVEVVVSPGINNCGVCSYCLRGYDSMCMNYNILGYQTQGGYAEYVAVRYNDIFPKPGHLKFTESAAMLLTFLTAYHMLFTRANLTAGESVLISSASSGVGVAALQLAKLAGCRVLATTGTKEKAAKLYELGADYVINYKDSDVIEEVKKATENKLVDLVFEHVGGKTLETLLGVLKKGGRMATCGATSGNPEVFNLRNFYVRQISLIGSYMGAKWELQRVLDLANQKKIKPVIDKVFPLKDARQAQELMLSQAHFGKIVLEI